MVSFCPKLKRRSAYLIEREMSLSKMTVSFNYHIVNCSLACVDRLSAAITFTGETDRGPTACRPHESVYAGKLFTITQNIHTRRENGHVCCFYELEKVPVVVLMHEDLVMSPLSE